MLSVVPSLNEFYILLLVLNIMIYLEDLTDYTWHPPDNYNVHVIIVAGKILLHEQHPHVIPIHILLYWYHVHRHDVS